MIKIIAMIIHYIIVLLMIMELLIIVCFMAKPYSYIIIVHATIKHYHSKVAMQLHIIIAHIYHVEALSDVAT